MCVPLITSPSISYSGDSIDIEFYFDKIFNFNDYHEKINDMGPVDALRFRTLLNHFKNNWRSYTQADISNFVDGTLHQIIEGDFYKNKFINPKAEDRQTNDSGTH